ncbi:MAG: endo-1,4-beta-xylanase [Sedimentisphaerales bacterium]|nr:endo-1,4-beta-xylanase [Sedimentisphaerales bacterium]
MSLATSGDYPALKDVFKDDFYIGVALSGDQILGRQPQAMAIVERHFNSITPENILKWEAVHPEPQRYDFEAADQYVTLGERLGMKIIGHTLVWHVQTPDWVFKDDSGRDLDRQALLERMRQHIFTVMGRYRGRIHGWDVVNEAVDADGRLRPTRWLQIIGEDYVAKAFEFARQADPAAELYYNDYDLERPAKREGVIRLIKQLQSMGIRVDGIGTQGHWFLDQPGLDQIEESILDLAGLAPRIMVTELDVGVLPYYPLDSPVVDLRSFDAATQKRYNPYPDGLPDYVQQALADRYYQIFRLLCRHRDKLDRVTFWAVDDGRSWRNYWPIRGRTEYPMLFDRQCRPKPAFWAVVRARQGKEARG